MSSVPSALAVSTPTFPSAPGVDTDPAAASVWCYAVHCDPDPGIVERLVGALSKRGLVPDRLMLSRATPMLTIDFQVSGLSETTAYHLATRYKSMPGVISVLSCRK